MKRRKQKAEPGSKAAALVWKQRFEPHALTGNGEEYKITHGWTKSPIGGGKRKRQFSVYHGEVDAQLADRRRVGDAPTLAEAKAIAEADNAKRVLPFPTMADR